MKKCSCCKQAKLPAQFYILYRGESGEKLSSLCRDCTKSEQKKYRERNSVQILKRAEAKRRRLGIPSVDQSRSIPVRAGRRAEDLVIKVLESKNVQILGRSNGRGPDIVISLNGERKAIEVKKAVKTSQGNSWYVCPVQPAQLSNDYFALVHEGRVWIQPMVAHLSQCDRIGKRTVTHICRALEEADQNIINWAL